MKKMNKITLALIALVALMLALPAAAESRREVSESLSATPNGSVSVEMIVGTIEVEAWDRAEVSVTGSIDPEIEELELDSSGDSISIEVDIDDGRHRNLGPGADLTIRVPRNSKLDIEAISASITIRDVEGRIVVESISGGVDITGNVTDVEVESISGNVEVDVDGALESGEFETVSANIDVAARLSPKGRFSFGSVNGTISLRLPADTSAEFSVETFSGKIENDLGPSARKTGPYLPAMELDFEMGSGEAKVSAESFNGKVRILER